LLAFGLLLEAGGTRALPLAPPRDPLLQGRGVERARAPPRHRATAPPRHRTTSSARSGSRVGGSVYCNALPMVRPFSIFAAGLGGEVARNGVLAHLASGAGNVAPRPGGRQREPVRNRFT